MDVSDINAKRKLSPNENKNPNINVSIVELPIGHVRSIVEDS